jgi:NAD(P)-dependent dehydrogenase (short-subunit alcohol dehydrogenase family)
MGQVEGKLAIVTGGASGIGAACATTLAREGAKVVVTDVDDAGGQAVVGKIGSAGGEAIYLHQDVTLEETWPAIIEATEQRFGRLDVMVANAGIGILCKSCRDVVSRLAATNRGEPRWRVPVGEVRRACDAPRQGWLHHHYVIGCRSPGIGRSGRLLRHEGRRTPVR